MSKKQSTKSQQTEKTDPWAPAIPYLTENLANASGIFNRYRNLTDDQKAGLEAGEASIKARLSGGTYDKIGAAADGLLSGDYAPDIRRVSAGGGAGGGGFNFSGARMTKAGGGMFGGAQPQAAAAPGGRIDPSAAITKTLSGQVDNPQLQAMADAATRTGQRQYADAVEDSTSALTESILPQIRSGAVSAGQYGGSRQGIAEGRALAERERQLGRNARDLGIAGMDASANLFGSAYESAQNRMATMADSVATRNQQADQFDAQMDLDRDRFGADVGFRNNEQEMQRAGMAAGQAQQGMGMFGQLGDMQEADLSQLMDYYGYPAQWELGLLSPTNAAITGIGGLGRQGQSTGRSTTTFSDPMGTFSNFAQAALMLSDGSVKVDVETVGYDERGRRWVDFSYVWEPERRHRGVIAQEVQATDPEAVVEHPSGLLMVDYSMLQRAA